MIYIYIKNIQNYI